MVVAAVIGFGRLAAFVRRTRPVGAVVARRGVTVASTVSVSRVGAATSMALPTGRA